jgi:hypothetical protein
MARHDDTLRVYSIGVNGVDDSGINQVDDEAVTEEEDDRAFVLLDTDRRNRPASTTTDVDEDGGAAEPAPGS